MLRIDSGVVTLFRLMIQAQNQSSVLVYGANDYGDQATPFMDHSCAVSVATAENNSFYRTHKIDDSYSRWGVKEVEIKYHPEISLFSFAESYHYAFSFPRFDITEQQSGSLVAKPKSIEDMLRTFNYSKSLDSPVIPEYFAAIESMHSAVLQGGFFGAVLPARWAGGSMKYLKWWNNIAPLVARIELPEGSVYDYDTTRLTGHEPIELERYYKVYEHYKQSGKELEFNSFPDFCNEVVLRRSVSSGNGNQPWVLLIWQKAPYTEIRKGNFLEFSRFRFSSYSSKLKQGDPVYSRYQNSMFSSIDIEECSNKFLGSDWGKLSVRPFAKMLKEIFSPVYVLKSRQIDIADPSGKKIIKPSEDKKLEFCIIPTIADIKKDKFALHLKLGANYPKVCAYSPEASGLLCELMHDAGYSTEDLKRETTEEGHRALCQFTSKLRSSSIIDNRDWLIKCVSDYGLNLCITETDYRKIKKQERWLNIQLAPIRRTIKSSGGDSEKDLLEEGNWEDIYDDCDIRAIFPEIWNMWEQRARKMKLHLNKFTYDFQFNDIITMACKQSIVNGNHMGLGKTREVLFTMLLRGYRRNLIVVPTRLVGVWQEEIETTIANYVRLVRKNWMGNVMSSDVQVIQYARDCEIENLRTFNIISYENLARVPKDAMFFKCPCCSYVACSLKCGVQYCPKCNEGKRQKGKAENKSNGLKKYRQLGGAVIDERVPASVSSGKLVKMLPVDEVYEKVKRIKVPGVYEEKTLPDGTIISVPVEKDIIKDLHLKWTFSHLLRNKFKIIAADESNYVNNPKANRSTALNNLTAKSRIPMTGTPVRGYPRSICNMLNWAFKRSVFPDYRSKTNKGMDGPKKFENKYGMFVERVGKPAKLVPKINMPEMFQQEVAPMLLRHTRHEPAVARCIPPKTPVVNQVIVEMDKQHRAYYERWLKQFSIWWAKKREEEDGKPSGATMNDLLVKLGYLINASTIPHFMLDDLTGGDGAEWSKIIGPFDSDQTVAKFQAATKLIQRNAERDEKTIAFCWRRKNLILGRTWCANQNPQIRSLMIDGTVSNQIKEGSNRSEKQERVNRFRYQDYKVLWAGIQTMKEGFNIPEANHGIFLDYTWEPADWQQALARMLRPAQKRTVYATFMCHKGTVDEYIAALVQLKARSADEGVDYQSFSDFNSSMIPDFKMYADAIVDGTEDVMRTKMWSAVEKLRQELEDEDI